MKIKKRKNRTKRRDSLTVNWWLKQRLQQELRWENDPKFWSKVIICYAVGSASLIVSVVCLLQADKSHVGWMIGYLASILVGLGLVIAAGLCHYTRSRCVKPVAELFKEMSIYARKHDRNVHSLRNAIRTKKDDFEERRFWKLLEEKLSQQKFRWDEIARAVYPLKQVQSLDENQTTKVKKFTEEVKKMQLQLLAEENLPAERTKTSAKPTEPQPHAA